MIPLRMTASRTLPQASTPRSTRPPAPRPRRRSRGRAVQAMLVPDVAWVGDLDAPVAQVDQDALWNAWQPSQKQNLHGPAVDNYVERMREGGPIKAILLETIVYADDGNVYIRTADGRHRLAAAHRLGLPTVGVYQTPALDEANVLGLL